MKVKSTMTKTEKVFFLMNLAAAAYYPKAGCRVFSYFLFFNVVMSAYIHGVSDLYDFSFLLCLYRDTFFLLRLLALSVSIFLSFLSINLHSIHGINCHLFSSCTSA